MLISTLIQFFFVLLECKNFYAKEIEVKLGAKIELCCTLKVDEGNTLFLWMNSFRLAVLNNNALSGGDWAEFTKLYSDFSYSKKDNTICLTKEQSTKKEENLKLKCTVIKGSFGATLDSEEFIIKIYEELKFISTLPSEFVTSVGESFSVKCEASGSPDLKVIWRKQGEGILSSGDSSAILNIKDVVVTMNRDKYTCEASINITKDNSNSVITQTMSLNVLYNPSIAVNISSFHTDLGITEVVKITVKGNPRPFLDCRLLNIIATRIITISEPTPFNYLYEVEIGNVTSQHLGDYNCTASNSKGSDQKTISLILGPENLVIVSANKTAYSNYYQLEWTIQSRAKISTSKITITTYEAEIESTSAEKRLIGNDLSPKIISQGTKENNWLFKFSQSIMNLTSDKLHKISVQMCRKEICIDAKYPALVRTQINDGKNVAVLGDLNLAQSSEQNNPGGGATTNVLPDMMFSVMWANMILLGLLLH